MSSEPVATTRRARSAGWGFGLLIALLAMMAVGKTVLHDSMDPDLFWHLRVADRLAAQGYPHALIDDLSFASIRRPWTPYSWLAELGMRAVWNRSGYRAALLIQVAMEAGVVIFIALAALEASIAACGERRRLGAGVAGFAGGFIALPYLSFRPVTLALFLLAGSAWILLRDRRRDERTAAPWLLIPLTILLTNIHLYAVFVPAALLALTAGAWWERRHLAPPVDSIEASRRFRRYAILTAATAVAFLVNPMLRGVLAQAWRYQFSDVMVGSEQVSEMRPFYRATPLGWVAAIFVAVTLACAIWNRRRLRVGEWLWIAGSLLFMLRLGRFAPIFAILAVPTLAATLPRLRDNVLGSVAARMALAALLLAGGVRIVLAFPPATMPLSTWLNRLDHGSSGYPSSAADYVAGHVRPRTHRLINEFTWGGFLEWRLGDDYQMLLDGRTQVFPVELWKSTYLGTADQRKAYLATVSADAAILPIKGSIFHDALLGLGWKPVFNDKLSQVLIPTK